MSSQTFRLKSDAKKSGVRGLVLALRSGRTASVGNTVSTDDPELAAALDASPHYTDRPKPKQKPETPDKNADADGTDKKDGDQA